MSGAVTRTWFHLGTLVTFSLLFWLIGGTPVFAEQIRDFSVDITVGSDGRLDVREEIVYDFGSAERHGIFREVTDTHALGASAWYLDRYIQLRPVAVLRNGEPELYQNEANEGLYLRIGNPDITISGVHTYTIRYVAEGVVGVVNGRPELAWDVTGTWSVPIEQVSVNLLAAPSVDLIAPGACYVGEVGDTDPCAEHILSNIGSTSVRFAADSLAPGEQLTIAQTVALPGQPVVFERVNWTPLWLLIIILWFGALLTYVIRWRYQFKTGNPIIAQYEPYQDFLPMFTGVLFDTRLDARDVSAGIVYLAQRGFLSIRRIEEQSFLFFTSHDYEITLKRPLSESENEFQRTLIKLLFVGQPGHTEHQHRSIFSIATRSRHDEDALFSVESVPPEKTVRLSDVKQNTVKRRYNQKLFRQLQKAVARDMVSHGFLERQIDQLWRGMLVVGLMAVVLTVIYTVATASFNLTLTLLFVGANAFILGLLAIERRTAKGYEALDHLKGFREYLSVTESERYKFHNAPALNPETFMQYLPYAIAFGVEEEWAEVFSGITLGSPDWFTADTVGVSFDATTFTSELKGFSSALQQTTSTSAASGGGSAGGGSGGGGGGSW